VRRRGKVFNGGQREAIGITHVTDLEERGQKNNWPVFSPSGSIPGKSLLRLYCISSSTYLFSKHSVNSSTHGLFNKTITKSP
jgi:hypothetical protein